MPVIRVRGKDLFFGGGGDVSCNSVLIFHRKKCLSPIFKFEVLHISLLRNFSP